MFFDFNEPPPPAKITTTVAANTTDMLLPLDSSFNGIVVTLRSIATRDYYHMRLNEKYFRKLRYWFGLSYARIGRALVEAGHEVVCIETAGRIVTLWSNPQSYHPLARRSIQ